MADLTVTPASVVAGANAKKRWVIAGATIAAGQVVYEDAADSLKVKLADANVTAASNPAGIALGGAANGQPVQIVYEDDDFTPGATLVSGFVYVLSATAGGIAPSADIVATWTTTALFVAKSTTKATLKLTRGGLVA